MPTYAARGYSNSEFSRSRLIFRDFAADGDRAVACSNTLPHCALDFQPEESVCRAQRLERSCYV
jgi:hypothetical protein